MIMRVSGSPSTLIQAPYTHTHSHTHTHTHTHTHMQTGHWWLKPGSCQRPTTSNGVDKTMDFVCLFVCFLRPWIWITYFETAVTVARSHLESGGTEREGQEAEDTAQASGGGSWHHWGPPGSGGVRRPLKPQTSFKGANDKLYLTNVGSINDPQDQG